MLSLEEVKKYLKIEQADLEKYMQKGLLNAYKVGGVYIRFRKDEVLSLKYDVLSKKINPALKITFLERLFDFWRFNNFYIISILAIIGIIYWFVHSI